jgi:hypothetical protein
MAHTKVEARTIDRRQTGHLPTHEEEQHLPLPDDRMGKYRLEAIQARLTLLKIERL